MKWWLTIALVVAACDSESEAPKPSTGGGSGSAKIGSAGGFAASMTADLAKTGDGSGKGSDAKGSDSGDAKGSDSAKGSDAKGSDAMAKGSDAKGSDAMAKGSDAKGSDAKGSDSKVADAKDAKTADTKDAKTADAKGSAAKDAKAVDPKDTKVADAKAGSAGKGSDAKDTKVADAKAGSAATPLPPPPPVKVGELAAIKLNMEPNWDRDVVEAGTISLVEKRSGKTFTFRYGFDDPRAPVDREQYKKFLEDQKVLKVTLDRQRGAAWYLEGTDGNGAPAFRYLVNYGGKKLICGGSLYKDADSSKLGDIRDRLVIQAKQICESLSL
jgi:hypothetical protein